MFIVVLTLLLQACSPTVNCVPSVKREVMPQKTENYFFAFQSKNKACGLGIPTSREQYNHAVLSAGGADIANAFQVKVGKGARVFTARHAFIGCDPNAELIIHSPDVVSLPASSSLGFDLAKDRLELGSCVSLEGFRFFDTPEGAASEWVTIKGEISFGTLEDTEHSGANPETWNSSDMIPLLKIEDKNFNHMSLKTLSGAPVFNSEHEVIALFSGVYKKKDGYSYLRLEEIDPEARYKKKSFTGITAKGDTVTATQQPSTSFYLSNMGKIFLHGCKQGTNVATVGVDVMDGKRFVNDFSGKVPVNGVCPFERTMGSSSFFVVNGDLYTARHTVYAENGTKKLFYEQSGGTITDVGPDAVKITGSRFATTVKNFSSLGTYKTGGFLRIVGVKNIGTTGEVQYMDELSSKVVSVEGTDKIAIVVQKHKECNSGKNDYVGYSGTCVIDERGLPVGIFTTCNESDDKTETLLIFYPLFKFSIQR